MNFVPKLQLCLQAKILAAAFSDTDSFTLLTSPQLTSAAWISPIGLKNVGTKRYEWKDEQILKYC